MPFIIMWKHGTRQCVLMLTGERISVRLIDGTSVLREVSATSAHAALRTAEIWEIEERRAIWHIPRPTSVPVVA